MIFCEIAKIFGNKKAPKKYIILGAFLLGWRGRKRIRRGTFRFAGWNILFRNAGTFRFADYKLFITLKDGTVHRLARNLSSTLDANTRLTLNVVIGNIFSGGGTGNFTIENWNEATETIEFPVVD